MEQLDVRVKMALPTHYKEGVTIAEWNPGQVKRTFLSECILRVDVKFKNSMVINGRCVQQFSKTEIKRTVSRHFISTIKYETSRQDVSYITGMSWSV
ncbi:uncharacterized protein [Parasteatoda tepidariorum]|uniref:uncharacterized protein isoform X2 n=1 Tax=Parasteatoda tepidariorum TaxID=114398 RepID=UPI001C7295FC|nr:uncharacterized protein LOC107449957 isoform X4 [Parasteatoda tepidariorum]